jgi:hypothetical protein
VKQIKLKKEVGSLPKPPLHKKNNLLDSTTNAGAPADSAEALLKMADEGLASIEQELNQAKKGKKSGSSSQGPPAAQVALQNKLKLGQKPGAGKQEIQTNFNLSFNNSFNTSYNNTSTDQNAAQPQILAFSSSAGPANNQTTSILNKIRSNSVGHAQDQKQEV